MKSLFNNPFRRFRHYVVGLLAKAIFYKDLTTTLLFLSIVFDKSL